MTTPVWPAGLPQSPLADGYGWQPGENVVRFAADAGVAQARRRATSALRTIDAGYWLTTAQLVTWAAFYVDEIAHGALWFDWPDPATATTVPARLMAPPRVTPVSGGMRWRLDLRLEARA